MGFLASAEAVIYGALAEGMVPPPPPDITRWCEENIVFDDRSPMPGPFNIERFPFLREIHEVLSPDHPAREVTLKGSAQFGKTESVIQPTLGAWHANGALDSLVVHPTKSAAGEWVNNKWLRMRRQAPSLRKTFGAVRSADRKDTESTQETVDRNGSLKVTSAGSPADLTGRTSRLVILDDLAKFEMTPMGDPEALAISRAEGFAMAKILRASTAMIAGTCRITRAYNRGDRRQFHVPCPHCGHMAPLRWENMRATIDPNRLDAAHFTCDSCGGAMQHKHKAEIVGRGRWVAENPTGDHPSFYLWRAYVPQRDWASIARAYAQVMGWSSLGAIETGPGPAPKVEAETEQTFYNDVLGLAYEQAAGGQDWESLRDRVELAEEAATLPRGVVPATGVILTAGVDCQGDRIEVQVVAYLRNLRRHVVDYIVIPHHIGDVEGRAALDALLKATWRTQRGLRLALDMMAVDVGTYTEDVWSWGKRHPWSRVILVKGSSSQVGPAMMPMKMDRRADGQAKRQQRRAFIVNVSQLKADFYGWLEKTDPEARGFVSIARGMGDEYFRQLTAEVRVLRRNRVGVETSVWELTEATRRNEGLDTMLYAEAAARRHSWAAMTDHQWDALAAERGAPPPDATPDLFDQAIGVVPDVAEETAPKSEPRRRRVRGRVH